MNYNEHKCFARIWKNGILNPETKNQCSKKKSCGNFCKRHNDLGGDDWEFGTVDKPVPDKIIYKGKLHIFKEEKQKAKEVKKEKVKEVKKEKVKEVKKEKVKEKEKQKVKEVKKEKVKDKEKQEVKDKEKQKVKEVKKGKREKKVEKKKITIKEMVVEEEEEDHEIILDYDYIVLDGVEYYQHQVNYTIHEASKSGDCRYFTDLAEWDRENQVPLWKTSEYEENHKKRIPV
uniref:Uncharacterized protein n=1 Tax=viral metagenome TaxID=1070528 RepID=A0A6C0KZM7_9ZZZZ